MRPSARLLGLCASQPSRTEERFERTPLPAGQLGNDPLVMEGFYFHLAQGEDKALALREAQLDMLKQYGKQITPFIWAGFVLVGDGSSGAVLKN